MSIKASGYSIARGQLEVFAFTGWQQIVRTTVDNHQHEFSQPAFTIAVLQAAHTAGGLVIPGKFTSYFLAS